MAITNKNDEQKRSSSNDDDDDDDDDEVDNDQANEPMDTSSSSDDNDDWVLEKLQNFFARHKEITSEQQPKILKTLEVLLQDTDFHGYSLDTKVLVLYWSLKKKAKIDLAKEAVREVLRGLDSEESLDESGDTRDGASKITDGLDMELAHTLDLDTLEARVHELFLWHTIDEKCNEFCAPYFALVQSSGMGKTKLFQEAKRRLNGYEDTVCMTILCVNASLEKDVQKAFFDEMWQDTCSCRANDIWTRMDSILDKARQEKPGATRVVLLFDEAQGLKEAWVFCAIRWWLRLDRGGLHVVAVFAGRNAKLANFFSKYDEPPCLVGMLPTQTLREAPARFKNYNKSEEDKKELYRPFYQLHTIACLCKKQPLHVTLPFNPGFPHAALYGRPLFGHYYLEGRLDKEKMAEFAERLVLGEKEYSKKELSCYSVLGTRVQMGSLNSFDMSLALVSRGYACLVDLQQQPKEHPRANVAFMSDPVCATMAMRLMDKDWTDGNLVGHDKEFWTRAAEKAFSGRLCAPAKGDAGKVFAALYLLFCGDLLRREMDDMYSNFVVSLDGWFSLLKNGGKVESTDGVTSRRLQRSNRSGERKEAAKDGQIWEESESTISFVQVCRNDLRVLTFCEEGTLENMYRSGRASYTYKGCGTIDMFAAIRVVKKESDEVTYHPLLVSVQNWSKANEFEVVAWRASVAEILKELRSKKERWTTAVCLMILLGCSQPPNVESDMAEKDLKPFPAKDVYRFVAVSEDAFGIDDAVARLDGTLEARELYGSHDCMPGIHHGPEDLVRLTLDNMESVGAILGVLGNSDIPQVDDTVVLEPASLPTAPPSQRTTTKKPPKRRRSSKQFAGSHHKRRRTFIYRGAI